MVTEKIDVENKKIFFRRNGEKNYLVICSKEALELPYQVNTIRYNKIEGLLPVQFFIEDGEYQYFYDISCKESLNHKMKYKKYTIREMRTILSDLHRCTKRMEDYLLDTNGLLLNPEYIFSDQNNQYHFCYYPVRNMVFEKSLEELFEYFMNHLDYQDEPTVQLAYMMYQKARENTTPFSELMKLFCEEPEASGMKQKEEEKSDAEKAQQTGTPDRMDVFDRNAEYAENNQRRYGENRYEAHKTTDIDAYDSRYQRKKVNLKKVLPYILDIAGGFTVAFMICHIRKIYGELSTRELLLWLSGIAGIIVCCGILSAGLVNDSEKIEAKKSGEKKNNTITKRKEIGNHDEFFEKDTLPEKGSFKNAKNSKAKTYFEVDKDLKRKAKSKENFQEFSFEEMLSEKYGEEKDTSEPERKRKGCNSERNMYIGNTYDYRETQQRSSTREYNSTDEEDCGDAEGVYGYRQEGDCKNIKCMYDCETDHRDDEGMYDCKTGEKWNGKEVCHYKVRRKEAECNGQSGNCGERQDAFMTSPYVRREITEEYASKSYMNQSGNQKYAESRAHQPYGEFDLHRSDIQDDRENAKRQFRQRSEIPATVVMKPQLLRAFHPALISKEKTLYPDIILKEKEMMIGKLRGIADICLESERVSRVHARIIQDEKGCSVVDLGSTNGTYVNGEQIKDRQKIYLEDGDEIRFADRSYLFRDIPDRKTDEDIDAL